MALNHFISFLSSRLRFAVAAGLLSAAALSALPADSAIGQELTIGSEAPALDIEHWMSDRDGEFSQVTEFESGKVYVVEFWATWCGPCISSMPHLVHLQDTYLSKGVQIISVSSEKLETVEKFLDKDVKKGSDSDAEEMTYAQLTGQYCLTTDPDRSVNKDYMKAAERTGIPCAFVVGKSGLIEWIGHPMRMEEVLESVVGDSWDREAFSKEFAEEAAVKRKFKALATKAQKLARDDDFEAAISEIDAAVDSFPANSREKSQVQMMRNSIAVDAGGELAIEAMNSVADSDSPSAILQLVSRVLRLGKRDGSLEEGMGEAILGATDKAVELAGDKEQILSIALFSKARALFQVGRHDDSIATMKKVLEIRDDQFLHKFLAEVETAKQEATGEPASEEEPAETETEPAAEPIEKKAIEE